MTNENNYPDKLSSYAGQTTMGMSAASIRRRRRPRGSRHSSSAFMGSRRLPLPIEFLRQLSPRLHSSDIWTSTGEQEDAIGGQLISLLPQGEAPLTTLSYNGNEALSSPLPYPVEDVDSRSAVTKRRRLIEIIDTALEIVADTDNRHFNDADSEAPEDRH